MRDDIKMVHKGAALQSKCRIRVYVWEIRQPAEGRENRHWHYEHFAIRKLGGTVGNFSQSRGRK